MLEMAMYKVKREILTTSEGVVVADSMEEATTKLLAGEWEYGRTEVTDDKVVSCEEVIVATVEIPVE